MREVEDDLSNLVISDEFLTSKLKKFPRSIIFKHNLYLPNGILTDGSFGSVLEYRNLSQKFSIMVKSFKGDTPRAAACFAVESAVFKALAVSPESQSGVVKVLKACDSRKLIFMEKVDKIVQTDWDFYCAESVADCFLKVCKILRSVNTGKMSYVDLTFSNMAYTTNAKTSEREIVLLDLGGFFLKGHGDECMTPSYVPPFMWMRNKEETGTYFEFNGKNFSMLEIHCVAYFSLLCICLGIFLEKAGKRKQDIFFMHADVLETWLKAQRKEKNVSLLEKANARYRGLLRDVKDGDAKVFKDAVDTFLCLNATELEMRKSFEECFLALKNKNDFSVPVVCEVHQLKRRRFNVAR